MEEFNEACPFDIVVFIALCVGATFFLATSYKVVGQILYVGALCTQLRVSLVPLSQSW